MEMLPELQARSQQLIQQVKDLSNGDVKTIFKLAPADQLPDRIKKVLKKYPQLLQQRPFRPTAYRMDKVDPSGGTVKWNSNALARVGADNTGADAGTVATLRDSSQVTQFQNSFRKDGGVSLVPRDQQGDFELAIGILDLDEEYLTKIIQVATDEILAYQNLIDLCMDERGIYLSSIKTVGKLRRSVGKTTMAEVKLMVKDLEWEIVRARILLNYFEEVINANAKKEENKLRKLILFFLYLCDREAFNEVMSLVDINDRLISARKQTDEARSKLNPNRILEAFTDVAVNPMPDFKRVPVARNSFLSNFDQLLARNPGSLMEPEMPEEEQQQQRKVIRGMRQRILHNL